MNFLEALKTGKPFKRCKWCRYLNDVTQLRHSPFLLDSASNSASVSWHEMNVDDLLATDWEVEAGPRISITEQEFYATCRSHMSFIKESLNKFLKPEDRQQYAESVFLLTSHMLWKDLANKGSTK